MLALVAAVAACSPATNPESQERVLTVLMADDWGPTDAVSDAIRSFEREHDDVRVSLRTTAFSQNEEELLEDANGLREIDVSHGHAFVSAAAGHARDITESFHATWDEAEFLPGAIDDVTWNGRLHGVPLDVNALVMVVNTTLLDEIGRTPGDLESWDGLRAIAAAAAERGVHLTHVPASAWRASAFVTANGGRPISIGEEPRFAYEDPQVVAAHDFMVELATTPGWAIGPNELEITTDGYTLFVEQEVVVMLTGTWDIASLLAVELPFDWTVVPNPAGPDATGPGTALGGSSLFVTEQADDPELAFDFLVHVTSPEYALRYAAEEGRLPARVELLDDPLFDDPRYRVSVEALPHARPDLLPAFPAALEVYTPTLFDMLTGEVPVAEGLATVQEVGEATGAGE